MPISALKTDGPLYVRACGDPIALASGRYTGPDGVVRQRFKKDLIRVGRYVHPRTGKPIDVTPDLLDHWEKMHGELSAAGVKVNLPTHHERATDAKENRGWIESIYRDGDTLYCTLEAIGEDGIRDVARNDVSLYADPNFVDGHGKKHEFAITHVALAPDPVVPGLGEFIPLAASRGILKDSQMPLSEFQKNLAAKSGMSAAEIGALTSENAEAEILKRVEANQKKLTDGAKPPAGSDADGDASIAGDGNDGAGNETPAALAASRGKRKPNPLVVKTVAQGRIATIDAAVKAGELNKAAADKLKERFCKSDAVALALSRGDDGSDFDAVMDTIKANKTTVGADGKEKTGPQVSDDAVELSRGDKSADADALEKDAERRRKEHAERFGKK